MPQTFQVLRCYSCFIFQIHPTKKSNKFECKVCGEKQSIKRHYGLGTGKECRIHVQKLNGIRGSMNETSSPDDIDIDESEHSQEDINDNKYKRESKWLEYVDKNEVDTNVPNDSMYIGDTEVVLDVPKKRRICSKKNSFKRKKNTGETNDMYDGIAKPCGKRNSLEVEANFESNSHSITERNEKIEPSLSELKTANDRLKKIGTRFVPPVINKSSKWAQYAETTNEDTENYNISYGLNEEINILQDYSEKQTHLITCEDKLKVNNSYNFKDVNATKKFKSIKSALEDVSVQSLNEQRKLPVPLKQSFVSKQSKWAQYNDDGNIKQDLYLQNEPRSHHQSKFSSSNPQKLFSLCDDSDLDNVLDI